MSQITNTMKDGWLSYHQGTWIGNILHEDGSASAYSLKQHLDDPDARELNMLDTQSRMRRVLKMVKNPIVIEAPES